MSSIKSLYQARGHDLVESASIFSALNKFLETKLQNVETFTRNACLRARKQGLFRSPKLGAQPQNVTIQFTYGDVHTKENK